MALKDKNGGRKGFFPELARFESQMSKASDAR
jgi:hypothetical protein